MPMRLSTSLILPAVLGAVLVAYVVNDRLSSGSASAAPAAVPVAATAPDEQPAGTGAPMGALPPNHPPIGGMSAQPGAAPRAFVENEQPTAITWKAPAAWKTLPNANAMRLATYRVGQDAEMSVLRAGGTVDANVQRWQGQFQEGARTTRTEKTVRGMKVTVVHIEGTFGGGGMPGAPAAGTQAGWAMQAAIVETPGAPYFFKLVGPADQVNAAKGAFDGLIDGITPSESK